MSIAGSLTTTTNAGAAAFSLAFHLLGWPGGGRSYVLLKLLQLSATAAVAIGIAALSSAVRAASFVIPASLGIQEGGTSSSSAVSAFPPMPAWCSSILRRMRELGWAAIGFLLLSRFNIERPLQRTSERNSIPPTSQPIARTEEPRHLR